MKTSIFKTFVLSLLMVAQVHFAYAQTASILPPAETTFVDQNGKPLTSGTVDFFVPNTTTRKTTWQDAGETIPNTNPVVLNGSGRAIILGDGSYRQVVKDRVGNLIWDQVTSSTGSGGGTIIATGDGDLVGTIKPWAGMTAPNQYMFAFGSEVSRTTFSVLYTAITSVQSVFCSNGSPTITGLSDTTNFPTGAAVELSCVVSGAATIVSKTSTTLTLSANSNVTTNATARIFPWGNGNATTTFNLPDFRGLIPVGNNNMGGVASANLTITNFGVDPNSIGGSGGAQNNSVTLVTNNLPPYTPNIQVANINLVATVVGTQNNFSLTGGGTGVQASSGTAPVTFTTKHITVDPQGGTSTPIVTSRIPPSKTVNYIIKVTPDTNSATATGVTSLGSMTGDIACGTNLLCTGNTISVVNTVSSVFGRTGAVVSATNDYTIAQIGGLGTKHCFHLAWYS